MKPTPSDDLLFFENNPGVKIKGNLPSRTDLDSLQFILENALAEEQEWAEALAHLATTLERVLELKENRADAWLAVLTLLPPVISAYNGDTLHFNVKEPSPEPELI